MTQHTTLWGGDKSDVVNHMGYRLPRGGEEGGREGERERERQRERERESEGERGKESERDLCPRAKLSCLGEALGT